MTPLIVKGALFGLLLLSAAVWDMRSREIPNLLPALLMLCGLIGFHPAASAAGLFLVGGPFLLAAQEAFFAEPEAESGNNGIQPADSGQPTDGTEKQEVETTDGE